MIIWLLFISFNGVLYKSLVFPSLMLHIFSGVSIIFTDIISFADNSYYLSMINVTHRSTILLNGVLYNSVISDIIQWCFILFILFMMFYIIHNIQWCYIAFTNVSFQCCLIKYLLLFTGDSYYSMTIHIIRWFFILCIIFNDTDAS